MSRSGRKASSDKQETLNVFSNHIRFAKTKSYSSGVSASALRGPTLEERSGPPQKMKRLKTRKERNQIRQQVSSSSQDYKPRARSRDRPGGPLSRPLERGRREKPVAKPFAPPGRPSIITDGRLTSFRGLFSHEVRSVDIERLAQGRPGEKQATNNSPSVPPPASSAAVSGRQTTLRSRNNWTSKQVHSLGVPDSVLDEEHNPARTNQTAETPAKRPSDPVVLSSSEGELFLTVSAPDNQNDSSVTPKEQEQANKSTSAPHVQLDDVPAHVTMETPPPDAAPAACTASPAERGTPAGRGQCREPGALIESETVGRLAARLCQTLEPPPSCCRRPLVTECREVLLQTMQQRHGLWTHKLPSKFSPELPDPSHITEHAESSSAQRYGDSTPWRSGFTRKREDAQLSRSAADNSSHREFVLEDFGEDTERGVVNRRSRRPAWWSYSPQDFLTNLQSPCEDLTKQRPVRAPSPGFLRATSSLYQICPGIEKPAPYPFSSGPRAPFSLQPRNDREREVARLLDQWSSDPDLAFLFHETTRRTQTSLDPLSEWRDWSPHQQTERSSERPPLSASTVSAFCPPEGFRYEPFYRFPHPLNSTSRSERSGFTLHDHSDIKELHLSPSVHSASPYSRYLP